MQRPPTWGMVTIENISLTDPSYCGWKPKVYDILLPFVSFPLVHAKGLNSLLILPTSDKHKQYPLDLIPIRHQIDSKKKRRLGESCVVFPLLAKLGGSHSRPSQNARQVQR